MKYFFAIIISALLLLACKSKKNKTPADPDVYYTCSMHPQIKENKPGLCPICKMELIAVEKADKQTTDEIELSPQQVQLGNIQVDTIRNGTIGDQMILTATLNIDQLKTNAVSARVMGRIDKLYFKNIGDYVSNGARLYDLYSEELNNAKQEYLLALEKQKTLDNSIIDFSQLVQSAKNKLLLWGMGEAQINDLVKNKKTKVTTTFYSTAQGYITAMDLREGDYVMDGGSIVKLADLSTLWAEAQVYTSQLNAIDLKGTATVQLPDMNGKEIKGNIEFVNPEINPDTRINLIRVAIANTGKQLKPGMPAYVVLKSLQRHSLTLPVDAVLRDGKGATVWVRTGEKSFINKMVETGLETGDRIEIKSGLNAGDVVVIKGAYLLQSEYIFTKGTNPMEGMKM